MEVFTVPVILAESLKKQYGDLVAVDNVGFTVNKGEMFGFLGPNGAGKTTIMKMIQCVSPRSDGKLEVFGMDVNTHSRKIKENMGVVPQENNLDPDFTVYENLLVYSRYFNISRKNAEKVIGELLSFVHIEEKKDTIIEHLSGGMKRRLLLARSLINDPDILILDEPTIGLDPQARHLIWDKLKALRSKGITIVLTTHYLDEAAQLCDRIVIMDHGKILVVGKPEDLVKNYIGSDIVEIEGSEKVISCLEENGAKYEIVNDIIQIYTNNPQEITSTILKACELGKMTVRSATLEDVFLKLTGRKLRE